jgi:hypothetical protein
MHHTSPHQAKRTTHRSPRPSISPYFIDEIGLTISDIQRARAASSDADFVAAR